jgi:hypothetical protein
MAPARVNQECCSEARLHPHPHRSAGPCRVGYWVAGGRVLTGCGAVVLWFWTARETARLPKPKRIEKGAEVPEGLREARAGG